MDRKNIYRYYNERKDKPMAAFLVADTSQNIMKGDCYENVEASEKKFHIHRIC